MLNRPLNLPCGAVLRNRIAKAAMSERLADSLGNPTTELERLYRLWSNGGAGLLLTGNAMISHEAFEVPGNVVISRSLDLPAARRWTAAGTTVGNHFWLQLNHPGRQALKGLTPDPVAPSAVPATRLAGKFNPPRALSAEEIERLIETWAEAASIGRDCGFTGVQIHAAHGYLISQFLSSLTNRRDDEWGGSIGGRASFLLETVRRVRRTVGANFPVSVKLNSADFQRGGFGEEESLAVIEMLSDSGIDLLEISGGTYEMMAMAQGPPGTCAGEDREPYFLDFARRARGAASMPVMVTGGFRSRASMTDVLESGAADVVGLARPLVMEPALPKKLLTGEIDRFDAGLAKQLPIPAWAGAADMLWATEQIGRLSKRWNPDPSLSVWRPLLRDLLFVTGRGRRQLERLRQAGLRDR